MDDEHKKTQMRFGKRRLDAIIIPPPLNINEGGAEVIPIRPVRNAERLAEISTIYNELIQPVVDILEKHEYEDEATILSNDCTEALWAGASKEQVRELIDANLSEIDPSLPSFVLDMKADPEPKPE